MAVLIKSGGITDATAPTILTAEPYATTGSIFYVDSVTGSDTNGGTRQEKPKATVFGASGALSVATTGKSDLIVCLKTHRETISSAYTFGTLIYCSIVGLGSGSDRATFTSSVAGVAITCGQAGTRFENLVFAISTAATTSRLTITAAGCEVKDCHFYSGASDATDMLLISAAADARVDGCTFTASATASSGTAQTGLRVTGASTKCTVINCTFDGGSGGWTANAGSIADTTAEGFRVLGLTLSNYSEFVITAAATNGYFSGITCDATSNWSWTE